MKPNAGLPSVEKGVASYKTGPAEFAEGAAELARAGVTFISGCCGTSPDFMSAIARRIGKAAG